MRYIDNIKPLYHNDISKWLASIAPWTHILTLTQTFSNVTDFESGSEFEEMARKFFFRMNGKVYGSDARAQNLLHATFLENRNKCGGYVQWHSHSLICIEQYMLAKFEREAIKQWKRLNERGTIDIVPIYDVDGAASYVAKHERTNNFFFANFSQDRKTPIATKANYHKKQLS